MNKKILTGLIVFLVSFSVSAITKAFFMGIFDGGV